MQTYDRLLDAASQVVPDLADLQAVIFDMDGVLVDTVPLHSAAWSSRLVTATPWFQPPCERPRDLLELTFAPEARHVTRHVATNRPSACAQFTERRRLADLEP